MQIDTTTLRAGSVFRYGYLASLAVFVPLNLLFGLSALFGGPGVHLNTAPVHGPLAIVVALVAAFVLPLPGALVLMLGTLVLRLIARGPALHVVSDVAS